MKRATQLLMACIIVATQLKAQTPTGGNDILWHPYEWQTQSNVYFENIPDRLIAVNFRLRGMPDPLLMVLNLSSPFSHISEQQYQSMVYRNPSIANQLEVLQLSVNHTERRIREMDLSINRQFLGEENILIQAAPHENENERIKGIIGFGIFHRNQKILLLDNVNNRLASLDALPASIGDSAVFVPMKVESGFIVIPVIIDGKQVEMYFDGTSRPAMVVYKKGLLRKLSSRKEAPEMLHHFNRKGEQYLRGNEADKDIYFGSFPLARFNVYYSNERAPNNIRGSVSRAFFDDYMIILDYKSQRFGLVKSGKLPTQTSRR